MRDQCATCAAHGGRAPRQKQERHPRDPTDHCWRATSDPWINAQTYLRARKTVGECIGPLFWLLAAARDRRLHTIEAASIKGDANRFPHPPRRDALLHDALKHGLHLCLQLLGRQQRLLNNAIAERRRRRRGGGGLGLLCLHLRDVVVDAAGAEGFGKLRVSRHIKLVAR